MSKVQDIPFRSIPHQSALFLNYLDLSPAALRFYQQAPTVESLERAARNSLGDFNFPRKEVASILRQQNESYDGDSDTLHQIDELEKPDSVAIVTGQQVGLFTGPLYTVYKALTAVRIAEYLRKRGIRAVPIFWMETEDHDLPEVTRRTVLDAAASVQTIDYREIIFKGSPLPLHSVGSLHLPETIREATGDYCSHLPDSIGKSEVQSLLESTYKPGSTFALAFAQMLQKLFAGSGLIFFNAQEVDAKQLISSVFQKALRESGPIHAALMQRKRELDAGGFHAQVSVQENSTVLFFFADGERHALEKQESGFRLKNNNQAFSLDELLRCAEQTPEKFSPSVLLRPLIQDHLFPTVAYVGGSAEVAYFAQIEILYKQFARPMPVIWPRNSFTLLEPEVAAAMDKWSIELADCFDGKQNLTEKVICRSGFSNASGKLEKLHDRLDQVLTEIKPDMQAIELPLADAVENARRKILHNIQHLKSQAIRMEAAQNQSLLNEIEMVLHQCYPNHTLQERELSILPYLARHGTSLLDVIRTATEFENFAHRVLRLE
jgi:bacillithiol biosynthesis cysteine-adding enzyme BshC